jgi:hypothetical protein
MPVSTWYDRERQRLQHDALDPVVVRMYRECRALSPTWWRELTSFWQLPEDFELSDGPTEEAER